MRGRFDIASRWPPGVWALVALTVALRLLVVPGYMVQASPDGGVTVVLCTADGAVTRTLHADGTASSPDDGQTAPSAKDSACVFALAGPALAAPCRRDRAWPRSGRPAAARHRTTLQPLRRQTLATRGPVPAGAAVRIQIL